MSGSAGKGAAVASRPIPNSTGLTASMLLVTGGAGFIGSNVVASLNEAGRNDIAVNDILGSDGKWRNLAGRQLADFVPAAELWRWLEGRKLDAVDPPRRYFRPRPRPTAIASSKPISGCRCGCSIGAPQRARLSSTHPRRRLMATASKVFPTTGRSGALKRLKPINLYGWSKHLFDLAVVERVARKDKLPPQWAGLKFFNVFGPNEYHKGEMMSLVAKRFDEAKAGKPIRLFKSHRAGIADGEQKRDFIYVDDAIAVVRWLIDTPAVSGIFNVGTGVARSFRDLMTAMFGALGRRPAIEYIDMPASIRDSYQYFTQAETENLRRAGYNADFTALEAAVKRYVNDISRSRRSLSVARTRK